MAGWPLTVRTDRRSRGRHPTELGTRRAVRGVAAFAGGSSAAVPRDCGSGARRATLTGSCVPSAPSPSRRPRRTEFVVVHEDGSFTVFNAAHSAWAASTRLSSVCADRHVNRPADLSTHGLWHRSGLRVALNRPLVAGGRSIGDRDRAHVLEWQLPAVKLHDPFASRMSSSHAARVLARGVADRVALLRGGRRPRPPRGLQLHRIGDIKALRALFVLVRGLIGPRWQCGVRDSNPLSSALMKPSASGISPGGRASLWSLIVCGVAFR
jgi:hypothetical protein